MQRILSLFAFFSLMSFALIAQTTAPAATSEYKSKKDGWIVNIDEAYELSQETGKPIMANFTGSDWCGWCKRLDASVFHHDEFKEWAKENVVLLELDFPRRTKIPAEIKEQNQNLQRAFKVSGFPTIWFFDLNRDNGQYNVVALGKTGYNKTVAEFTGAAEKIIANR